MTSILPMFRRARGTGVGVAALALLAAPLGQAGCSGDDPPAAAAMDPDAGNGMPNGGGDGDSGTDPLHDSGMGMNSGGDPEPDASPDGSVTHPNTGGSGGDGGASVPPDAGCIIGAGAGQITAPEAPAADASVPVCWAMNWSAGSTLASASTAGDDTLGSISADDLNVAWLAVAADAGNARVVHYANRHYPTDAFSPPLLLDPGTDADLDAGMALSVDGLRLIVVLPDRKGFTEYVRDTVDDPFTTPPAETQFTQLNTQISHYLPPGALCADPVLSADDLTFYFSVYGVEDVSGNYGGYVDSHTIYSSTRTPFVSWPQAAAVMGEAIEAHCSARRRPSGISSDQLTLFYWDELSGSTRAAFRSSIDAPFDTAVELGNRPFAQPNPDCTMLYYSGTDGAADTDVLTAD
jgi:hypothetical protein